MNDDLIKRSDAIGAINGWLKLNHLPEFGDGILYLVPSADRWIPCSERLPQLGQKVLASTKKTVFTQVFKGYYSDPKRWAWEHNSVKTIEAWMPLPTEYKGADDETDKD